MRNNNTNTQALRLPKVSKELALIRQNKLQNLLVALTHVRFDVITVTFVLISVALSEPSFHLSRGRGKLGSNPVARTELRNYKQAISANSSPNLNEAEGFNIKTIIQGSRGK
ncbi:MAG: hypothetical protein KME46_07185 [Brasilonema angustatum HA4187-MV1]|jgi:hypothetical protein|nr:hypothetical protein [Brasilonema angustatum HA4187-MV1]